MRLAARKREEGRQTLHFLPLFVPFLDLFPFALQDS